MKSTEDTVDLPTRPRMTPVKHSSLEEIHLSDLKKMDLSLSHSSTQPSGPTTTTTNRGDMTRTGGTSSLAGPSDLTSVNIQPSSGDPEMMKDGPMCGATSGTTLVESRELVSHGSRIKRKMIEGLVSVSVIGLKVASVFILPFFSVFSNCTEVEINI